MTTSNSQIQFGVMAVEMEFITASQLGKAVNVQMKEDLSGMKHRLLGEILVDMGFMTENQVAEVLKTVKKPRNKPFHHNQILLVTKLSHF